MPQLGPGWMILVRGAPRIVRRSTRFTLCGTSTANQSITGRAAASTLTGVPAVSTLSGVTLASCTLRGLASVRLSGPDTGGSGIGWRWIPGLVPFTFGGVYQPTATSTRFDLAGSGGVTVGTAAASIDLTGTSADGESLDGNTSQTLGTTQEITL